MSWFDLSKAERLIQWTKLNSTVEQMSVEIEKIAKSVEKHDQEIASMKQTIAEKFDQLYLILDKHKAEVELSSLREVGGRVDLLHAELNRRMDELMIGKYLATGKKTISDRGDKLSNSDMGDIDDRYHE